MIIVWPEISAYIKLLSNLIHVDCIRINTEIANNKTNIRIIAMTNPIPMAFLWSLENNFHAIIKMKRILSIPKAISKKVRVSSADRISVVKKDSMIYLIFCMIPLCLLSDLPTKEYSKV